MKLGVPVQSIPPARVIEHFGSIGAFFSMDKSASSAKTRELVGLGADADRPHSGPQPGRYFRQIVGTRVVASCGRPHLQLRRQTTLWFAKTGSAFSATVIRKQATCGGFVSQFPFNTRLLPNRIG